MTFGDISWKPPVTASAALGSGILGDVKMVEQNGDLYGVLGSSALVASAWVKISSGTTRREGEAIRWFDTLGKQQAEVVDSESEPGKHRLVMRLTQGPFGIRAQNEGAGLASGTVVVATPGGEKEILDQAGRSDYVQWGSKSNARDFGLVTELPTGTLNVGDRCIYQADSANGVLWSLVYDGVGSLPWKKIGGPPLYKFSNEERRLTNVAYTSLPTDPLELTVPLKGDYDITIQGALTSLASNQTAWLSYAVGATAASDNWGMAQLGSTAGILVAGANAYLTRHLAVAASAKIVEKAKCGGAYECGFNRRRLIVDPVRVG